MTQDEHSEALKAIAEMGVVDVAGLLMSAHEHVEGLETVLFGPTILPLPAFALARAAQEASVLFCYVVDLNVFPATRLARVAALRMHTAQENRRTLALFGGAASPRQVADATSGDEGLRDFFTRAGFELKLDKSGTFVTTVSYKGNRAPLSPQTTEQSLKYIPLAHNSWVIGSGATHSRTWLSQGLEGPWDLIAAAIVLPLLDVADAVADALGAYVGHNVDKVHQSIHLRRTGLFKGLGNEGPMTSWTDYARMQPARTVGP